MKSSLNIDLHKLSKFANMAIPILAVTFLITGYLSSFYFHFLTVTFLIMTVINLFYLKVQRTHTVLRNFGILGQARYMIESIGPEFRQYLFLNDREERPFNRVERTEIYRKAKDVDSASSFGSLDDFDAQEIKIRLHDQQADHHQRNELRGVGFKRGARPCPWGKDGWNTDEHG